MSKTKTSKLPVFNEGDRVVSARFGKGTIVGRAPSRTVHATYWVKRDEGGSEVCLGARDLTVLV